MPVPADVRVLDAIPRDRNVVRLRTAALARDMDRLAREPAAVMWSEAPGQMPDRPRDPLAPPLNRAPEPGTLGRMDDTLADLNAAETGKRPQWLALALLCVVGVWLTVAQPWVERAPQPPVAAKEER